MSTVAGFFLPLGVGLGIGLFAGPTWWLQAIVGAMLLSLAHVVTRSENYRDYLKNLGSIGGEPQAANVRAYLAMQFLMSSVLIWAVVLIVFLIRWLAR